MQSTERILGWVLVVFCLAAQWPLQSNIDRYRNTFRVVMYPTAKDEHIAEVERQMRDLGLEPERSLRTSTRVDAEGNPREEEVTIVSSLVPRRDWNRDLQRYSVAVQRLPRVAQVVPGINEQGLPLDRLQELNVQDVGIIVMAALIGGFRKSAANVMWLQTDANWREGRHYRTVPLARVVTTLDPHFVDAWTLTCWHLAYNMSVEAATPDEAADLIRQGIEFAERGLSWNANTYELYQEIGWTYYDKLQNYAKAAEYLKLAIEHPHPTYLERLIAHAYERIPDIPSALFWYNVSLKKYGHDPVATGAIITINERYVPAWDAFAEGDYEEALFRLKRDWQKEDPDDTIALHFTARIFERKASDAARVGDRELQEQFYRRSFETWMRAGKSNASNRLARRRVLTLARNWGWSDEVPQGWNDVGLPDRWAESSPLNPDHDRSRAGGGQEADEGPQTSY